MTSKNKHENEKWFRGKNREFQIHSLFKLRGLEIYLSLRGGGIIVAIFVSSGT